MLIQKCKSLTFIILMFVESIVSGQHTIDVKTLLPDTSFENIHVKKLYSDTNSTSFLIWVKSDVKSHKHVTHTETIQIIEGNALMTIEDKIFEIKENDFFVIPQNTFHSVKVTSTTPLKLISIQSPIFDGSDRIFE
ncbi:MAG: cupin domain-containing protein [Flavobacteriales bacterium]